MDYDGFTFSGCTHIGEATGKGNSARQTGITSRSKADICFFLGIVTAGSFIAYEVNQLRFAKRGQYKPGDSAGNLPSQIFECFLPFTPSSINPC